MAQDANSSILDISSAHERIVKDYLKLSRTSRAQSLKDIESSVTDFADSRLLEDTFTSDEVRQMLEGLCTVLKGDVSSDLIHGAHTAALMLQQIFKQADKWHLKLQVDLAQLESREGMKKIADLEQLQEVGSSLSFTRRKLVAPLNSAGGDQLLQAEIQRLSEENGRLRERLQLLEEKATSALSAKDSLQADMKQLEAAVSQDAMGGQTASMADLQQKVAGLELELQNARARNGDPTSQQLENQLEKTSKELLKVTYDLEEARKDLETQFNSTSQYVNMKKMLASKNKLIAELRSKLLRYEGDEDEEQLSAS